MRIVLENPPFGTKNANIKDRNTALVMKALTAVGQKEAEVTNLLDSLTADSADVLMKYVYKGLQKPDNSGFLLKLHGQLVEKCGIGTLYAADYFLFHFHSAVAFVGCIVRAIVDRKGP